MHTLFSSFLQGNTSDIHVNFIAHIKHSHTQTPYSYYQYSSQNRLFLNKPQDWWQNIFGDHHHCLYQPCQLINTKEVEPSNIHYFDSRRTDHIANHHSIFWAELSNEIFLERPVAFRLSLNDEYYPSPFSLMDFSCRFWCK